MTRKELKEYNDLVSEYNNLYKENKSLKKQLEEYKKELEKADSITQSCIFNGKKESEISYRKCLNMLEDLKEKNQKLRIQVSAIKETFLNQQKEFIEWLSYRIDYGTESISYRDSFREVLQKYKEIIGNNINVGTKGVK